MRLLTVFLCCIFSVTATAAVIIPKAPDLEAKAYILIDATSGRVLVEHNADERIPPASLTKMMTSYVAIHELTQGNATEATKLPVSVNAWRMGGSKMFVREGTEVPLIDLLRGIIVQSGNDASITVAEYFAGSEDAFAGLMNQFADRFGMTNTNFMNATGWPNKDHYSSARDMAQLSLHIVNDHPQYYGLYAEKYFEYNNIRQPNRNKLLWRDTSVDGLKTGHTDEAGYCLAASAKRDGMRLVAVVLGTKSEEGRAREMQKLFAYGFRYYETRKVYNSADTLKTERVWMGKNDSVELALANDLYLTVPRGLKNELLVSIRTDDTIKAPIKQGQVLGHISISVGDEVLAEKPLVAQQAVAEAGFFGRLIDHVRLFFSKIFS